MKKFFYFFAVLAAGAFLSAGALWAAPVAPLCPWHRTACIQKSDGMYCSVSEESAVDRFVPGRAGLYGWERVPEYRETSQRCAGM